MATPATLIFFCGKMAAGKSTLARQLAEREHAMLMVQDEWLDRLFPGEIVDIPSYLDRSRRLGAALAPHIRVLLARGVPIVLDFPANTRTQRAWFRQLVDGTGVRHELHYLDVPDDVCKRQLRERSAHLPPGTPWTSDAEFDAITAYFEPPAADEGFTVIGHGRG